MVIFELFDPLACDVGGVGSFSSRAFGAGAAWTDASGADADDAAVGGLLACGGSADEAGFPEGSPWARGDATKQAAKPTTMAVVTANERGTARIARCFTTDTAAAQLLRVAAFIRGACRAT